ncbi:MAG: hypothetical protein C0599_05010, partial [Salinivirgaceae bacterium]
MKAIITTLFITFSLINAFSQDILGVWHGIATTPDGKEVTFVYLFEKDGETYKSTMAVPTFNVSGVKPKSTKLLDGKLTISSPELGMKYEGNWNKSTDQIEGKYTEGGVQLDLTLIKGNPQAAKLNRPQEPVKPYPYHEEEVTFQNENAGV